MDGITLAAIGWPEIVGIIVIVLVIFGAGRLAGVGKALGTGVREFRDEARKPGDEDGDDEDASVQQSSDAPSKEKA
jgi:sec-independent protein translocase protein TatA